MGPRRLSAAFKTADPFWSQHYYVVLHTIFNSNRHRSGLGSENRYSQRGGSLIASPPHCAHLPTSQRHRIDDQFDASTRALCRWKLFVFVPTAPAETSLPKPNFHYLFSYLVSCKPLDSCPTT